MTTSSIPDNPDWNSFRIELVSMHMMNDEAWRRFMDGEIAKLEPVEE